jgi:hypothetical protein
MTDTMATENAVHSDMSDTTMTALTTEVPAATQAAEQLAWSTETDENFGHIVTEVTDTDDTTRSWAQTVVTAGVIVAAAVVVACSFGLLGDSGSSTPVITPPTTTTEAPPSAAPGGLTEVTLPESLPPVATLVVTTAPPATPAQDHLDGGAPGPG